MPVNPIPNGYYSVTPYLFIRDAASAIEFYQNAFSAIELMRMNTPDGKIGHAEIKIGNAVIMLADEYPDMGFSSPQTIGGSGVSLMIYTESADDKFKQAIDCGAKVLREVQDQFYGDRSGSLQDPFGHIWTIATHIEDLSPEELSERTEQFFKQQC